MIFPPPFHLLSSTASLPPPLFHLLSSTPPTGLTDPRPLRCGGSHPPPCPWFRLSLFCRVRLPPSIPPPALRSGPNWVKRGTQMASVAGSQWVHLLGSRSVPTPSAGVAGLATAARPSALASAGADAPRQPFSAQAFTLLRVIPAVRSCNGKNGNQNRLENRLNLKFSKSEKVVAELNQMEFTPKSNQSKSRDSKTWCSITKCRIRNMNNCELRVNCIRIADVLQLR